VAVVVAVISHQVQEQAMENKVVLVAEEQVVIYLAQANGAKVILVVQA
jgi:hypothetical protein